jgi:tetratricopeptide (TPR) repeat protein
MSGIDLARVSRRALHTAGALVLVAWVLHASSAMAGPGAAYFEAGQKLVAEGDETLGLRYVATSILLEPDNFAAQIYFLSMVDRARFRGDVAVMEQLRLTLPTYVPLLERLALLYDGKQRQAEAGRLYEAWRALRPDSAEAPARAGEHYRFTGQHDRAVEAFSRHLNVVEESDYAVERIAESEVGAAIDGPVAAAVARAGIGDVEPLP